MADVTGRVKLGTTILVLPHRHPVLAAKRLATLDPLSTGRVMEEGTLLGAPLRCRMRPGS